MKDVIHLTTPTTTATMTPQLADRLARSMDEDDLAGALLEGRGLYADALLASGSSEAVEARKMAHRLGSLGAAAVALEIAGRAPRFRSPRRRRRADRAKLAELALKAESLADDAGRILASRPQRAKLILLWPEK
jgi:hypothetical protein